MATKQATDPAKTPARRPRKTAAEKAAALPAVAVDTVESGTSTDASASNFYTQASDTVRKAARNGKDRATEALGDVAGMINEVADTIDNRLGGNYGEYARKAAGSIIGVADNLKAKDIDELVDGAREFVRKQPAVAIGAAAAVGFVLTRLVFSGKDEA